MPIRRSPSGDLVFVTGADLRMGGDVRGDVLYFDGTNYTRLAAGNPGEGLRTEGPAADPGWDTFPRRETAQYVPRPLAAAVSPAPWSPGVAAAGGVYELARPVRFQNLWATYTLGNAGDRIRYAVYQADDGLYSAALPLRGVFTHAIVAAGNDEAQALDGGGTLELSAGYFWILAARLDATGQISVWSFGNVNMYNQTAPAGMFPANFFTLIDFSAGAPPAILNPPVDTTVTTNDRTPIVRFGP